MHAEAALGHAVLELVQERDAAGGGVDVDLHASVPYFRMRGELLGEGVVMGGEEADAADVRGDVMKDGLGDGNAVVGGCAAPELVEDDEGSRGRFRKDLFGFGQFDEEGGLGGEDVVVGPEAGHDTVDGGQTSRERRDVAPDLSHDNRDTSLLVC